MIEVNGLTKYFDEVCAVNNVSFTINDGEITGLLGPNGAGKTTTMRIITGFLKSSGGQALVDGINVEKDPVAVKKLIGYLPESAPLYGDMMVYDYLQYVARIHEISDESRVVETARTCGLLDVMHKNINELSKGYRQRVGLAHAMVHDPKVLILDEPTTGLDPNQIIEIRNLIKEIGKKKTVILSTHILPEVEATCERVIIINKGNIVADSRTSDLQKSSKSKINLNIIAGGCSYNELKNTLITINGISDIGETMNNEGLVSAIIAAGDERDLRPDIFRKFVEKGWTLYEMKKEQNTLEKVFRDLTVGGDNE